MESTCHLLNNSIIEANQSVPQFRSLIGQVVSIEENAYDLYNDYANFEVGFGIRVNKTRYCSKTQKIRQKDYVCSCEGFKRDTTSREDVSFSRLNVRSGCHAMIRFTIQENGEWKVTHHVTEHNHYLAEPHERALGYEEEIDENEPWVMKSKRRAKASKGDNKKVRIVTFDKTKSVISSTCKMFETEGFLCRHTLKILSLHNFTKIPESYILKRWTKEAKSMEIFPVSKGTTSSNIEKQVFSSSRFRSAYNVILKASETETTKAIWDDGFRKIMLDINKELGSMKLMEDHSDENPPLDKDRYDEIGCAHDILIKNPRQARIKRAPRTRIKSSQEKRKTLRKKPKQGGVPVMSTEQVNTISPPQPLVASQGFQMYPTSYNDARYGNEEIFMFPPNGMSFTRLLESGQQYHPFQMTQGTSSNNHMDQSKGNSTF